jgi:hypothetical protein
MENLTPRQQEKLKELSQYLQEGGVGILKYMMRIEEQIKERNDMDLKTITAMATSILKDMKGDKGDSYVITEDDKDEIVSRARGLLDDDNIIREVYGKIRIPYDDIAKKASSYITIPEIHQVNKDEVVKEVMGMIVIPPPEKGEDADEERVIRTVEDNIEKNLPQFGTSIRDALELLEGEERLDASAIKGLRKLIEQHGGSGSTFYGGGVGSIKGIVAGTGVTVDNSNPQFPVVSASGGGGLTELPATGTVNGSNKSYTFTRLPSYIVVDGAWYKQTTKSGETVWTWNSGTSTATFNTLAPQSDIFGIA